MYGAYGHDWQKSTFSGGGDGDHCVEVATSGRAVLVREGDEPRVSVAATPPALAAFIRHNKRAG